MGDYYIQSINKTFFLSGSLIYHTDNSGSNANKSAGTLLNKNFIMEKIIEGDNNRFSSEDSYDNDVVNITKFINMTNVVSGSMNYLNDKEIL